MKDHLKGNAFFIYQQQTTYLSKFTFLSFQEPSSQRQRGSVFKIAQEYKYLVSVYGVDG